MLERSSKSLNYRITDFDPEMGRRVLIENSAVLKIMTFVLMAGLMSLSFSSTVLAKSRRPITDVEIRQKKQECYADVESGLWGWECKSSTIAKENCALRCLSPTCYQLVYEGDPLEEGEKDLSRGQEFKFCMYKLSMGESIEGIRGSFDY